MSGRIAEEGSTASPQGSSPVQSTVVSSQKEVKEALRHLPTYCLIGPLKVRFIYDSAENSDAWGAWDDQRQEIYLDPATPTVEMLVVTLKHEINHALCDQYNLGTSDTSEGPLGSITQEQVVESLAIGWTLFYKANPWFLYWIDNALHKGS